MRAVALAQRGRYLAWLLALGAALALVLLAGWHVLPWLRALWAPTSAIHLGDASAPVDGTFDTLALLVTPLLALTAWSVGWRARHAIAASRRPWRLALVCTLLGSYAFALLLLVLGALAVLIEGGDDRLLALAVLVFSWAFALPYGLLGWALFVPLALPATAGALVLLRRAAGGLVPARTAVRPPSHAAAAGTA
jgi:hypothetical protein